MVILQDSYILDQLNHRITNIFRKENIPVRVSHIPYILGQALSYNTTERTGTRDKCLISNTKLCLRRNAAYQFTCNNCTQQYIGSTTRFIHDLNNENSSVKKHIFTWQKRKTIKALHWNQDYCARRKRSHKTTSIQSILHREMQRIRELF